MMTHLDDLFGWNLRSIIDISPNQFFATWPNIRCAVERSVMVKRAAGALLSAIRTTMVDVFERLTAEGLLEGRTGAGTYVSQSVRIGNEEEDALPKAANGTLAAETNNSFPSPPPVGSEFVERLPHTIRAFTTALPAVDMFPIAQWTRQSNKHWREQRDVVLGYGNASGFPPLRRAICGPIRGSIARTGRSSSPTAPSTPSTSSARCC